MTNQTSKPELAVATATIIGAGAIGLSWAALFLANGLTVTINDPRPDIREAADKGIFRFIDPGVCLRCGWKTNRD